MQLVMTTTDGLERRFDVESGRTVIGRSVQCDVRIPLPSVADSHCEIVVEAKNAHLIHLHDGLSTLHNGTAVKSTPLAHADTVQVGPVVFHVLLSDDDGEMVIQREG